MPGPSWPGLRAPVLACGPGEPLFPAGGCSAPTEAPARWRGHHPCPACSEAPPGTGLGLRGWRRASPLAGLPVLPCPRPAPVSSDPLPPAWFTYFNYSAAPAGTASDGWRSAEWRGGSAVKHGIRPRAPALQKALAPTLEAGPRGCQEGRPDRRREPGGRGGGRHGEGGSGVGEGRRPPRLIPTSQPAGGLWAESYSCRHAAPRTLLIGVKL